MTNFLKIILYYKDGDNMKKYYIFAINNKNYNLYRNNKYLLFSMLKNLYYLDDEYLNYGVSIYDQLCIPINKEIINNYYQEYKYFTNKFYINENIISINNACIVLLTKNFSLNVVKRLCYYVYPLFVCNFDNGEYFFLESNLIH